MFFLLVRVKVLATHAFLHWNSVSEGIDKRPGQEGFAVVIESGVSKPGNQGGHDGER